MNPAWVKGHKKVGGRKKGSKNKLNYKKVIDVLLEKGLNPTEEILKLIPELEISEQVKTWLFLLTYTQARPPVEDVKTVNALSDLAEKMQQYSDDDLERLIKEPKATVRIVDVK